MAIHNEEGPVPGCLAWLLQELLSPREACSNQEVGQALAGLLVQGMQVWEKNCLPSGDDL